MADFDFRGMRRRPVADSPWGGRRLGPLSPPAGGGAPADVDGACRPPTPRRTEEGGASGDSGGAGSAVANILSTCADGEVASSAESTPQSAGDSARCLPEDPPAEGGSDL
mmetsp:Transcript_4075/g.17080  ORF Transcript_4075/g.17080 Transcript_4075/m.17080 type:complete len:110 (-) Transcript_4075:26-355(-)